MSNISSIHPSAPASVSSAEILRDNSIRMSVSFPPSTIVDGYRYFSGWMDDAAVLRISIKEEELQPFLESSPFKGIILQGDRAYYFSCDERWWDVSQVKVFKSGSVNFKPGRWLQIVLTPANNQTGRVIVYLSWNET